MTVLARLCTCLALVAGSGPALAMPLEFPSVAINAATEAEAYGSARLPITGYDDGNMQTIWAEGAIRREAWHIRGGGLTTLQILAPLRAQLAAAGYEVIFECAADDCGGFDFRYALPILPEPGMHVDIGDFRYLTAQRSAGDTPDYATLMVSRSREQGFVQVTTVGAALPVEDTVVAATKSPQPDADLVESAKAAETLAPLTADQPLGDRLESAGRAVLGDLTFQTGSAKLGSESVDSLTALAAYLIDRPERAVVLVGHTDAEGALDSNIALSRQRADAVRAHLVRTLGVPEAQVEAEGVGYLAPLTSNQTEAGRSANRRVEVILK